MTPILHLFDEKQAVPAVQMIIAKKLKEALAEAPAWAADEKWWQQKLKDDKKQALYKSGDQMLLIRISDKNPDAKELEQLRMVGAQLAAAASSTEANELLVLDLCSDKKAALAAAEGAALWLYQFLKYRKNAEKEANKIKGIYLQAKSVKKKDLELYQSIIDAVYIARDLVNEPQNTLDAPQLALEIELLGKASGFKTEILNKTKIESLKMGGLLAVNKGSQIPPTFTIMEWKPEKTENKKPIVLVGKGIVYDTGGLSLKPTPNSMDTMKCDMAGAAVVAATMYAVARAALPLHVVALVPATDNRPGENAYTPGDVITMYDGTTIEVLNTDAEGRMILADALAYAKKFKPEVVLDFATLTGAAAAAIGPYGIVCMGTADESVKNKLKSAGEDTYERLVEFPFWDEYKDLLKSDIADMKNIGGPIGGAITAGKFLEHFTDYPWMHFDIAGPAFLSKSDGYRTKNASGIGVRMTFQYLLSLTEK